MKSIKMIFLEKTVLGRKTDLRNPEDVILHCINLAYRDMLTAGRYYIKANITSTCNNFKTLLEERNYEFSKELINDSLSLFGSKEKIGAGNKYVTRYGLTQKLVNMTFKYLYVFSDYTGKKIDFSACDCPLDSVILNRISSDYVWSKLSKEEYDECQKNISEELKAQSLDRELSQIGNLAFDFKNW